MNDATMLDHALGYAANGLPVFPLIPGTKRPATPNGLYDATTDEMKIRDWWTATPKANVAARPLDGMAVLDVDVRNGGTLDALGDLPATYRTRTGGGGWHIWFWLPQDCTDKVRGKLDQADGIDIKTSTGYLVMPPSIHPDGGRYILDDDSEPANLPAHLLDRVVRRQMPRERAAVAPQRFADRRGGCYWDAALTAELDAVACAPEGSRNDTLNTAAFNLGTLTIAAGIDPNEVADQLTTVARGIGLDDWEADATIRSGLTAGLDQPREIPNRDTPAPAPVVTVTSKTGTLDQLDTVARRWLGSDYDLDALHAVIAAAAVERLDGDPVWMLLVSGSGNAKTETVQALDGAGGIITSTISSQGALLSATSRKERATDATGGLLRKIGDRGLLVIKDVTSILSMSRDARAEVLGALREVYDGRWSRNVGTDGGRTLDWDGRIVVIGAVTTAWDRAHGVVSAMGDRFVLVRMDSHKGRQAAGRRAIGNTGSEATMRAELSEAVCAVLNTVDGPGIDLTDHETDRLLAAADLVTLARTAVESDYQGNPEYAHDPEMPTRFAKQLAQIVRGAVAVGLGRDEAMNLSIRCARDSMPPLRLSIIDDVAAHPDAPTRDVRQRLNLPRNTVDRGLQALHMLGVLTVREDRMDGRGTVWRYSLRDGINPDALNVPDLAVPRHNGPDNASTLGLRGGKAISGTSSTLAA